MGLRNSKHNKIQSNSNILLDMTFTRPICTPEMESLLSHIQTEQIKQMRMIQQCDALIAFYDENYGDGIVDLYKKIYITNLTKLIIKLLTVIDSDKKRCFFLSVLEGKFGIEHHQSRRYNTEDTDTMVAPKMQPSTPTGDRGIIRRNAVVVRPNIPIH